MKRILLILMLLTGFTSFCISETIIEVIIGNFADEKVSGELWIQEDTDHKPIDLYSESSDDLYTGIVEYNLESNEIAIYHSGEISNSKIFFGFENRNGTSDTTSITIDEEGDTLELMYMNDFIGYRLDSHIGEVLDETEFYVFNKEEKSSEESAQYYTVEIRMEIMGTPLPIASNLSSLVLNFNRSTYSIQQIDIAQSNIPDQLQANLHANIYRVRNLEDSWYVKIQMDDETSAKVTLVVRDSNGKIVLQDQASGAYGVAMVSSEELY